MRIAVLPYPGVSRACYQQLIGAALHLARSPRMQQMAPWSWTRFSGWLHSLPFEMDAGPRPGVPAANRCTPPQRMRKFPPTMNCWERVLHQLAWFAARGTERVTIYDHATLVGRHIEVLVPPTTNLAGAANGPAEQAGEGILAGLQGGLQGGLLGGAAGPYGALAGFILGAGAGVAKRLMEKDNAAAEEALPKEAPRRIAPSLQRNLETLVQKTKLRTPKARTRTQDKRGKK